MPENHWIQQLEKLEISLNEDQIGLFCEFEKKLYEANEVMNLTRVPREECGIRHFGDSLLFQDILQPGFKVLDIGTGPGFPAWPIACARPDLKVTALDSSNKMTGFLRQIPLPNLEVVTERAESWGKRERFDVVTGRAVAPLHIQLELSAAPCKMGGLVLPMRTPNDLEAIQSGDVSFVGLQLEDVLERPLPGTDIVRVFPLYRKIAKTPRQYPRSWAEIKAEDKRRKTTD